MSAVIRIDQAGRQDAGPSRRGEFALLQAALLSEPPRNAGVLLLDLESGAFYSKIRSQWPEVEDAAGRELLEHLDEDIRLKAAHMGGGELLTWFESALSNTLRITSREPLDVTNFPLALERLYAEHVAPAEVRAFVTHLPLYSLEAAAGKFGADREVEAEDWVLAPKRLRLSPDMFVARVAGRSMEPRIPDGSLNLFRFHPVGSRQGKIVLVERFGAFDETARYTVKRYTSRKVQAGEDEWRHERIRLEPLNPEFEAWDAEPQDFTVVAEWLRVIE